MSTNTRDVKAAPSGITSSQDAQGLLGKAGIAAVIALAAMIATPVIVISSNLFSAVDYYDPTTNKDPVTWMHENTQGIIFGLQGVVVAAGLAVMMVCIRRVLGSSIVSDMMLLAGALPLFGWLTFAGATAQTYSTTLGGDIESVQADPGIRAMVGYAQLSMTQGLVGGAGVSLAAWAVLLYFCGRSHRLAGRVYLAMVSAIAAVAVGAMVLGLGGFAAVLSMPLMLVVAVTLLRRARRTDTPLHQD